MKAAILLLLACAEGSNHCLMLHIMCFSKQLTLPFAGRISEKPVTTEIKASFRQ